MSDWLLFYIVDSFTRMAYSDSAGYLEKGKDTEGILSDLESRFGDWAHWGPLARLQKLLLKNKLLLSLKKYHASPLSRLAVTKLVPARPQISSPSQICYRSMSTPVKRTGIR
jgi:hypothetical protein